MGPWPKRQPAVKVAIAVLSPAMSPVLVTARVPHVRPLAFVKVDRIGGSRPNPVTDIARMLIECWAPDSKTAEDMIADADKALCDAGGTIVGSAFVRAWKNVHGFLSWDDPAVTDQRRWQMTGDLHISTTGIAEGS